MATETTNTASDLWRHWQADQPALHQALATIREGAGPLGLHRRQVRDAHDTLTAWAEKWRPLLPEMAADADQIAQQIRLQTGGFSPGRVKGTITQVAERTTAQAHPDAETIRAQARAASQATDAADMALREFEGTLAEKLQPYARVAYHPDLAAALAETQADLDALTPQVRAADQRVQALTQAPEIRALPVGRLGAERDRWKTDRQAAQEAARTAALQKAALEHENQARRRLDSTHRSPAQGGERRGRGIGF
jgi:hypothetical protein